MQERSLGHLPSLRRQGPLSRAWGTHLALSEFLEDYVAKCSRYAGPGNSGDRHFHLNLLESTNSSVNAVLVSVAYLTRLRFTDPSVLQRHPGSLVYTACLMLAYKFLEDAPFTLASWAMLSHYPGHAITRVAREILQCLDYRLHVTKDSLKRVGDFIATYTRHPTSCSMPEPFHY